MTATPLYLGLDSAGKPTIRSIGVTANNQELLAFFQNHHAAYDFSALVIPSRIQWLYQQSGSNKIKLPEGQQEQFHCDALLIVYKDKQGELYSATDFELGAPKSTLRFMRHAFAHKHHRVFKLNVHPLRNPLNISKAELLVAALAHKSLPEAHKLIAHCHSIAGIALMSDVTDHLKNLLKLTPQAAIQADKIDDLLCWHQNKRLRIGNLSTPLTQCLRLATPDIVRFHHPPPRRQARYLAKLPVAIIFDTPTRSYTGMTLDISVDGLRIVIDELLERRCGEALNLGFPNFSQTGKRFNISQIPYEVMNVTYMNHQTVLGLHRKREEDGEHVARFFEELIELNHEKLPSCLRDVIETTSARLHEELLCANLVTLPLFVAKESNGQMRLEKAAVNDINNHLVNYFISEDSQVHLFAIGTIALLRRFSRALKRGRKHPKNLGNDALEFYFYKTTTPDNGSKIIAAANTQFKTASDKLRFLKSAINAPEHLFVKVSTAPIEILNDRLITSYLHPLEQLAHNRSADLHHELEQLIGCGECIDITREVEQFVVMA